MWTNINSPRDSGSKNKELSAANYNPNGINSCSVTPRVASSGCFIQRCGIIAKGGRFEGCRLILHLPLLRRWKPIHDRVFCCLVPFYSRRTPRGWSHTPSDDLPSGHSFCRCLSLTDCATLTLIQAIMVYVSIGKWKIERNSPIKSWHGRSCNMFSESPWSNQRILVRRKSEQQKMFMMWSNRTRDCY